MRRWSGGLEDRPTASDRYPLICFWTTIESVPAL